jgi:hypothetical protein
MPARRRRQRLSTVSKATKQQMAEAIELAAVFDQFCAGKKASTVMYATAIFIARGICANSVSRNVDVTMTVLTKCVEEAHANMSVATVPEDQG